MAATSGQQAFCATLERYLLLYANQLADVRCELSATVAGVMEQLAQLNSNASQQKVEAEKAMEDVYFHPDQRTLDLIADLQSSVSDLVDRLQSAGVDFKDEDTVADLLADSKASRIASQFNQTLNQVGGLDAQVRQHLFAMLGTLSSKDVVLQRLGHVSNCIDKLKSDLKDVFSQPEISVSSVEKLSSNLQKTAAAQFKTAAELRILKQ